MSYKNTMKIFSSNFSLVWKQVLYFCLCLVAFAVCTYYSTLPLINLFKDNYIDAELMALFDSFYARNMSVTSEFFAITRHVLDIISSNFREFFSYLLLVLLFAFLLPYIFFQMSYYNICSIIYKKLSMNMHVSYVQNMISTLKPAFIYAITNLILSIPFWCIYVLLFEIYIGFFNNFILRYLGLVAISGISIVLTAVRNSFTSMYVGTAVSTEEPAPVAFGNSMQYSLKNFFSILATFIVLELTFIVANGFIGVFTFLAGLLLSIPAVMVLQSTGFIVTYCNKTCQRYYINPNFIFNPVQHKVKKYEIPMPMVVEEKVDEKIVTTILRFNEENTKISNEYRQLKEEELAHENARRIAKKNAKKYARRNAQRNRLKKIFGHNQADIAEKPKLANAHSGLKKVTSHDEPVDGEVCACGHHHGASHSHGTSNGHSSSEQGEVCACGHHHGAGANDHLSQVGHEHSYEHNHGHLHGEGHSHEHHHGEGHNHDHLHAGENGEVCSCGHVHFSSPAESQGCSYGFHPTYKMKNGEIIGNDIPNNQTDETDTDSDNVDETDTKNIQMKMF